MPLNFKKAFTLLFLAIAAYGQIQERVAIINTLDNLDSLGFNDLSYLTDRLRETAVNVLPESHYGVMTTESIVAFLGSQERAVKVCNEASCLAELGRMVSADYVAQARIGRFNKNFIIKTELYSVKKGTLINSFTGESKNLPGLLAIIDEKAPALFKKMLGASGGSKSSLFVAGGISGVQSTGGDYEFEGGKNYLVNIVTEPAGAVVSFNGVPDSRCAKTPCKLALGEGNVRIIAALEQYERADTTVFIKQNNQSIIIRLKSNFGVLDIKPAYLDGIGKNEQWSLSINGKASSSLENNLSPAKYKVELSHRCYETLSFDAGINKNKREVFDMSAHIKLKKGGLSLNVERNGELVSEPVFANGKQIGETPFSGSVPLCAEIEIGKNREKVDVKLKPNEKVEHTVKSGSYKSSVAVTPVISVTPTTSSIKDSRDNKTYKVVKIGTQTWMAENLNYEAAGSKCYDNKPANCKEYGRLYDWKTAMMACPSGWHLPSNTDWYVLMKFVNPSCSDNRDCAGAGTKLKAASGWNKNGNDDTDAYGFSALPGGFGDSDRDFYEVGYNGRWWSSAEYGSNAYHWYMFRINEDVGRTGHGKNLLFSVRCLQN